ncbi:MAG: type II toxin-antitoxin system VapC family toxin [Treponema sp.]|nr:type II toxin-antitoxin system VapC family toxin [Treponema sp.]
MLYYLDTNIILDLIDGKKGIAEKLAYMYENHTVRMSDIVYYEVLRGFKHRQAFRKFSLFMNFCEHIQVDFQTLESLEIASDNYAFLLRQGMAIEDDDILIGSLAIANNAILVTNNVNHLSRLKDIQLENWGE